jgi:hypothetical protein
MFSDLPLNSQKSRFWIALVVAVIADIIQIAGFPLFAEGAISPPDDILDAVLAVAMTGLLGWHWEFMPSFAAKLIPGVDLVPFWTLAVANVYRKWKRVRPDGKVIDVKPVEPKPLEDKLIKD